MLQRGNQFIGPLRGETSLWRGRDNEGKSWLAGLPKQLASGDCHVMTPTSRDLLGRLPKMII